MLPSIWQQQLLKENHIICLYFPQNMPFSTTGEELPGGLQPAQGGISQQTQGGTCNYYDSVSVDAIYHSHINFR